MSTFETSTTVGGQGEIHVASVPFLPGTEVDISISPKATDASPSPETGDRVGPLLAALDHARNIEPSGSLKREELYDRNRVR